jgi:hypothetical protein
MICAILSASFGKRSTETTDRILSCAGGAVQTVSETTEAGRSAQVMERGGRYTCPYVKGVSSRIVSRFVKFIDDLTIGAIIWPDAAEGARSAELRIHRFREEAMRFSCKPLSALSVLFAIASNRGLDPHFDRIPGPQPKFTLSRHRKIWLTTLLSILILCTAVPLQSQSSTAHSKKHKVPCAKTIDDCPLQGCGTDFDPNLNRLKNITSIDGPATLRTLTWMKKLDDPENFKEGGSREELTALGEGQEITVVAYLLVAKPELGGESCNCGLQTPAETDNHLVLVTGATVQKFPLTGEEEADKKVFHSRELESQTAEFTPRLRERGHPNFTREKAQPLIDKTDEDALFVRVTGQLLFDSEHFISNPLVRVNNWEIHPVFKLEYCSQGDSCKANSDAGWKSLDDLP